MTHDKKFYVVEPNRRPAGGHIWDLSSMAFPHFKPWDVWIKWAVKGEEIEWSGLHESYAGLRRIIANKNGTVTAIDSDKIETIRKRQHNIIKIDLKKKIGDVVTAHPKDNSQFLGQIMAQCSKPDGLKSLLANVCLEIQACFEVT